jgi:hypothetical protein
MYYNYELNYCPGDKNLAGDALSEKLELHLELLMKRKPEVLFDPSQLIALASIAALDEQEKENVCTWTDALIVQEASKHTSHVDPLDWPAGYKLNNDLVLASEAKEISGSHQMNS